ncbi:MAG: thymidylate synthase [Solirubrobacteraceae bacterium]
MRELQIEAQTIGAAWLRVADRILTYGAVSVYDGIPILELERVTVTVSRPRSVDPLISGLGDPERLEWMHANFTDQTLVAELGLARSYASRLHDYAGTGRDQVQWVIDRLRADQSCRDATITTFEPLADRSYIPCVSLLDFWVSDRRLQTMIYAHSIDFGTKGYGNLVEAAALMEHVAAELSLPTGRLDLIVKSAHIYQPDVAGMRRVLDVAAAQTNG